MDYIFNKILEHHKLSSRKNFGVLGLLVVVNCFPFLIESKDVHYFNDTTIIVFFKSLEIFRENANK